MEYLAKITASVISFLSTYKLWLSVQKSRLENEKLRQELKKMRRGG
ncbi:hypothetical protein M948_20510 [Virgibacillus sp. CM-4]|nr:hypothetical protein M948_20510 [Virgibacillus sp. CM-4]